MSTETRPASATELVLARMYMERVGHSFLDSGQETGRAYQQTRAALGLPAGNQWGAPDLPVDADELFVALRRDGADIVIDEYGDYPVVDTWKYLVATLDYDEHLDDLFRRYAALRSHVEDTADQSWDEDIQAFLGVLEARSDIEVSGGPYGDDGGISSVYTYNNENPFDRDFIFTQFHVEQRSSFDHEPPLPFGSYAFLQLHNGADARGGFTKPRLFRLATGGDGGLYDWGRMGATCEGTMQPDDVTPGQLTIEGGEVQRERVIHSWSLDDSDEPRLEIIHGDAEEEPARHSAWTTTEYARRDDEGIIRCPHDGTPVTPWFYA